MADIARVARGQKHLSETEMNKLIDKVNSLRRIEFTEGFTITDDGEVVTVAADLLPHNRSKYKVLQCNSEGALVFDWVRIHA